jgi:hypothetical protein
MCKVEEALRLADFGGRVAEDEVESLHGYFVETEQWRKLFAGEVDIVFGSKGAGKSALYSLLVSQKDVLRLGRRTVFVAAENPRGTPAFRDLVMAPPASEEEFRGLWKLYFLTLLANYLRHHFQVSGTSNAKAATVINALVENGLLAPNTNLLAKLKAVIEYIRKYAPVFEGGVVDPSTGIKYTGKITLGQPSNEQNENGFVSVSDLLNRIDEALRECSIKVWIVLDRLDVAFSESAELEGNALRSLFRTYLDMLALTNVDVKIFLRDDIWAKIVEGGFREASHVTRVMTISWDNQSLLNLIVRRVAHNDKICKLYEVNKEDVLKNATLQKQFFYRAFPEQVDVGQNKPSTFDWMASRTADGTKRTAPRELIHLLTEAREQQIKLYELGNSVPPDDNLFSRVAITQALPEVSKTRFAQTLCAEYPSLKSYLDKLDREKTQQTPETLASLWKCSEDKALKVADQLTSTGFFERRGSKDEPIYWVPFLYRDALNLIQGAA